LLDACAVPDNKTASVNMEITAFKLNMVCYSLMNVSKDTSIFPAWAVTI
jgi:hypothetical protein